MCSPGFHNECPPSLSLFQMKRNRFDPIADRLFFHHRDIRRVVQRQIHPQPRANYLAPPARTRSPAPPGPTSRDARTLNAPNIRPDIQHDIARLNRAREHRPATSGSVQPPLSEEIPNNSLGPAVPDRDRTASDIRHSANSPRHSPVAFRRSSFNRRRRPPGDAFPPSTSAASIIRPAEQRCSGRTSTGSKCGLTRHQLRQRRHRDTAKTYRTRDWP